MKFNLGQEEKRLVYFELSMEDDWVSRKKWFRHFNGAVRI